jgi:hypothetical protein
MAFERYAGTFLIPASSSADIAITAPGFTPKCMITNWCGDTSASDSVGNADIDYGWGVCGSTAGSTAGNTVAQFDEHNAAKAVCATRDDTGIVCQSTITGGDAGNAYVKSYDANGFTIGINTQFTRAVRVNYIVFGGTDITNVADNNHSMNSPPNVGFQADFLFFLGSRSTTSWGGGFEGHGLSVGMCDGSLNQCVVVGQSDDNSANMDTDCYGYSGEVMAHIPLAGGDPDHRWLVASITSTSWTVTQSEGTTKVVASLAIKGGSWEVGNNTTKTNTTPFDVTVTGFDPEAMIVMSHGSPQSTQDTADSDARVSGGFCSDNTTPDQIAQGWHSLTAAANATCTASIFHGEIYTRCTNGVSDGEMKVDSFGTNKATLSMVDADAANNWFGYLLAGPPGAAPSTAPKLEAMRVVRDW